jgi:hypothetical protein
MRASQAGWPLMIASSRLPSRGRALGADRDGLGFRGLPGRGPGLASRVSEEKVAITPGRPADGAALAERLHP